MIDFCRSNVLYSKVAVQQMAARYSEDDWNTQQAISCNNGDFYCNHRPASFFRDSYSKCITPLLSLALTMFWF